MSKSLEAKCYSDWRRSEAYAIPITEEGNEMAQERYKQFKKGLGIRYEVCYLPDRTRTQRK